MLPSKAWLHLHIINLGADVCIPFGLSVRHRMCNVMVQAFEVGLHGALYCNEGVAVDCVENFIAFLE